MFDNSFHLARLSIFSLGTARSFSCSRGVWFTIVHYIHLSVTTNVCHISTGPQPIFYIVPDDVWALMEATQKTNIKPNAVAVKLYL